MIQYEKNVGVTISGSPSDILNGIANIAESTFRALSVGMSGDICDDDIESVLREMFDAGLRGARDQGDPEVEMVKGEEKKNSAIKLLRN